MGVTVGLVVNGSSGATPAVFCHTVLPLLIANAREPVMFNDWGTAVA